MRFRSLVCSNGLVLLITDQNVLEQRLSSDRREYQASSENRTELLRRNDTNHEMNK